MVIREFLVTFVARTSLICKNGGLSYEYIQDNKQDDGT